ncbi:MAG: class Ib ribonucleoside-diphosphate reductase assembly flavoprotein NrdI [Mycoplasmatales bacterium]
MKIVYISLTGNVESFVDNLSLEAIEIISGTEEVDDDFIVITNTVDHGEIDFALEDFLDDNVEKIKGVAASGNHGYDPDFAVSADTIAKQYNVPIIHKFEDEGTEEDVKIVEDFIKTLL